MTTHTTPFPTKNTRNKRIDHFQWSLKIRFNILIFFLSCDSNFAFLGIPAGRYWRTGVAAEPFGLWRSSNICFPNESHLNSWIHQIGKWGRDKWMKSSMDSSSDSLTCVFFECGFIMAFVWRFMVSCCPCWNLRDNTCSCRRGRCVNIYFGTCQSWIRDVMAHKNR